MSQALANAAFLEGSTGWTGGSPTMDETIIGALGRRVLTRSATVSAGNALDLTSASLTAGVAAGVAVTGMGMVAVEGPMRHPELQVQFLTSGDAVIETASLPVQETQIGAPSRGVTGFARFFADLICPATTAKVRLKATATALGSGTGKIHLLKPYLAIARDTTVPARWAPGSHANADLQRPDWPQRLPPFLADGYSCEPLPVRDGFRGDNMIPGGRQFGLPGRFTLSGRMSLTAAQADLLEAFHLAQCVMDAKDQGFWIVRPDTDQLCRASFAEDGEPRLERQNRPGLAVWSVVLDLETV